MKRFTKMNLSTLNQVASSLHNCRITTPFKTPIYCMFYSIVRPWLAKPLKKNICKVLVPIFENNKFSGSVIDRKNNSKKIFLLNGKRY